MRAALLIAFASVLLAGSFVLADDQADLKAVLAKAIEAMGGKEKAARLHTVSYKSKWTIPGAGNIANYEDQTTLQGFEQYRSDLSVEENGKNFRASHIVNGEQGWFHINGKSQEYPKDHLFLRKKLFYVARLPELILPLQGSSYKLAPLGELKIGASQAVGILASHKVWGDVGIFFDKKTGLPVKSECRFKTPDDQEHVLECLFGDYKDFDGHRHFTKVEVEIDGQRSFEVELSELKTLDKLDDSNFAKP